MMFDTMFKVVKGFSTLNNNVRDDRTKEYLKKLIRVSKKNGLTVFKEEKGLVLYYGDKNREMVKIEVKRNRQGKSVYKINFNNLVSEVTKVGIAEDK